MTGSGPGTRALSEGDWKLIKHFAKEEVMQHCQDGAWHRLDAGSVYLLDAFAGYLVDGSRLLTSVAFMPTRTAQGQPTATWNDPESKTHEANSWHYYGRAFDLMFPKNTLATAWLTAMRFPKWGGVGAYPFWKPDPGLHLDTRWVGSDEQGRGFRVFWYADERGRYHYLNDEFDIAAFLELLRAAS